MTQLGLWRRFVPSLLGVLLVLPALAGCDALEEEQPSPTGPPLSLARLPKLGKAAESGLLLKLPAGERGVAAAPSRELDAIVAGLRSVLATRPGTYVQTTATVLDNETLAAQNSNPEYGQLLARWERQTGYFAAFDLDGNPGDGRLLRASAIVSRYNASAGARAAYAYVVDQQGRTGRRFDINAQQGGRPPWDEAVVFYQERTNNGRTFGEYTLIFRAGRIICFVTNIGLSGAVSTRDTADLTQGVVDRLLGGQ